MQTTANSNYTVLVVDDDVALGDVWRDALSGAGFNVLTSSSGPKGLDTIRHVGKVDVVLLDYNMPWLDGSQTLEHLKDQFPHVKTIGVTGVDASRIPDTFRKGVEQLLLKPIKISDLVGSIHSVLGVAVGSKTAKRGTTYWIRFGLWYALYVGCCYGILRWIYQIANETMLAH
ncbi:MAG TPA: response regulator [Verrucomicrobiae bacterium]|nr:response regulator [Verrucomicrobiae bacterium]